MDKQKLKELLTYLSIVIVIVGAVSFYFHKQNQKIVQDYSAKVTKLNEDLKDTKSELGSDIEETKDVLSSDIGSVRNNLNVLKDKSNKEFKTLSDLIKEIEKQSNLKLDQLKSEVRDIQIKSADFSAIVDDVLNSVVSIKTSAGQGSGAFIRSGGYIVTNLHVISGSNPAAITAITYGNQQYPASLVGYDTNGDIAVLKVNKDMPYLEFGNSDEVKVGTKVIAAGNPAGLSFTITEGIVSALRANADNGLDYIQTDVPINPGNSGGPLINQKGEIIGINNFKYGGFESLGFAIASNEVDSIVNTLIGQYEQQLAQQAQQQ